LEEVRGSGDSAQIAQVRTIEEVGVCDLPVGFVADDVRTENLRHHPVAAASKVVHHVCHW